MLPQKVLKHAESKHNLNTRKSFQEQYTMVNWWEETNFENFEILVQTCSFMSNKAYVISLFSFKATFLGKNGFENCKKSFTSYNWMTICGEICLLFSGLFLIKKFNYVVAFKRLN